MCLHFRVSRLAPHRLEAWHPLTPQILDIQQRLAPTDQWFCAVLLFSFKRWTITAAVTSLQVSNSFGVISSLFLFPKRSLEWMHVCHGLFNFYFVSYCTEFLWKTFFLHISTDSWINFNIWTRRRINLRVAGYEAQPSTATQKNTWPTIHPFLCGCTVFLTFWHYWFKKVCSYFFEVAAIEQ